MKRIIKFRVWSKLTGYFLSEDYVEDYLVVPQASCRTTWKGKDY